MNDLNKVIKKPCLTEKGMKLQETNNQLVIKVDNRANKLEIKIAVETLFKVKVTKVRTLNIPGKNKRVGRHTGLTSDYKKAVVSLAEGHKIDFLSGL